MQILEKCEDVNTKNQYEKTPLHLAAEEGHIETVKSLLANGADPSIQDKNKNQEDSFAFTKYLVKRGYQ